MKLKATLTKSANSLNSIKYILDKEQLKLIYIAHFHSHINCCSNLFSLIHNRSKIQIFLMQKRAIRTVCGVGYLAHTELLFKTENILPFAKFLKCLCTIILTLSFLKLLMVCGCTSGKNT